MTAAIEGGEWSAAPPGRTLPLGKTRYLFYRRLGGPQGGKSRPNRDSIPDPPARSQSLYWLNYPAHHFNAVLFKLNFIECVKSGIRGPCLINELIKLLIAYYFSMTRQSPLGQGLVIVEASRSHLDTPHWVWLIWTSDQPEAETCTRQHTTLTTDTHQCHGGIRTRSPSERATANPRLWPRSHWDWS